MSIKTFRERSPIVVGILSIIGIAGATTFSFFLDRMPFVKQAYDITAEFADAAGLNADNQVRVAGIKVGTVKDIQLVKDRVIITMEIDNGTEIPKDANAELKLATILGTKFIDIEATGGGPYLEDGDTIPLENTETPYEIYQAANQGTGVIEDLDGEALNDLLVELTTLTRVAKDEVGEALEGLNELGAGLNARNEDLRSMLSGANDLTKLLADEGDEINRLIDSSNNVLGYLSQKREELQSLLESTRFMAANLTDVLQDNRTEVDQILDRLHGALKVLADNVEHVDMALEYAGPSSKYFGSILIQGPWADIYSCALVLSNSCENDE